MTQAHFIHSSDTQSIVDCWWILDVPTFWTANTAPKFPVSKGLPAVHAGSFFVIITALRWELKTGFNFVLNFPFPIEVVL